MTGLKNDTLYNIATAEELIIAEFYGRRAIRSDSPDTMYIFSAGRGKTAKFNGEYFKASRERRAKEGEEDHTGQLMRQRESYVEKTMEELHERYLGFEVPVTEQDRRKVEAQLEEVAKDFVVWCNGMAEKEGFDCCLDRQKSDISR